MVFTDKEYSVLDKIATKSKMDCWFHIIQDENGNDHILDLENNNTLPIHTGISQLVEGMTNFKDYALTEEEIAIFKELISGLNIKFVPLD